MRGSVLLAVWAVHSLALVVPGRAAACSPPSDGGVCPMSAYPVVVPETDAVDVPLNVEVDVTWTTPGFPRSATAPSTTFRVRAEDGEIVELVPSPTTRRWRSSGDLRPNTRYLIEDYDRRVPGGAGCEPASEYVEIASFTTGPARDDAAPATPVEGRFDACCRYESCENSGCCGPYRSAARGVVFTVEPDTIVEYRVDGGAGTVFGSASTSVGFVREGMFGHPAFRPSLSPGDLEARAIDAAGNASGWSARLAVPGCDDRSRPDAGFDWSWTDSCVDGPGVADAGSDTGRMDVGSSATDGGVGMDGGIARTHATSCSATAGRSPSVMALFGLVGLALAMRRRALGF